MSQEYFLNRKRLFKHKSSNKGWNISEGIDRPSDYNDNDNDFLS